MKIKKLFSMVAAAFFVLALTGAAGAADPCSSCKGCVPGDILCAEAPEQGEEEECESFDYESYDGYCSNHRPCRVIFDICECEDTTANFASDQTIGVRMTILVNGDDGQNGVYWTNSSATASLGEVALELFANKDSACDAEAQSRSFHTVAYYLDSEGENVGIASNAGSNDCSVPTDQKVVMLSSGVNDGYTVLDADETNQLHDWWIDIPAMVYDSSEITRSDVVSVKIELLNKESGGICASCVSICECTVVVGTMCCEEERVVDCILFPYVLQQEEGWHSGIAITNLNFSGAAWTPTIIFTDKAGAEFVATPTYNEGTVAFLMDDLLNDEGLAPAPGAGWLKIHLTGGNSIDGYQYNMLISGSGMFGAAVLPRQDCR
jgi:hypothetical protein